MLHVRTIPDSPNYRACLWLDLKECISSLMTTVIRNPDIPNEPAQMLFGKHEHQRRAFQVLGGEARFPEDMKAQIAEETKARAAIVTDGEHVAGSAFACHVAELILSGGSVEPTGDFSCVIRGGGVDQENYPDELYFLLREGLARAAELRAIAELLEVAGIKAEECGAIRARSADGGTA